MVLNLWLVLYHSSKIHITNPEKKKNKINYMMESDAKIFWTFQNRIRWQQFGTSTFSFDEKRNAGIFQFVFLLIRFHLDPTISNHTEHPQCYLKMKVSEIFFTYGWQCKKWNPKQSTKWCDHLALPSLRNHITIAHCTQRYLMKKKIKY